LSITQKKRVGYRRSAYQPHGTWTVPRNIDGNANIANQVVAINHRDSPGSLPP
jgi:hypothetical protein